MPSTTSGEIQIHPVTASNWDDFERLFSKRGSPHYCWCSVYRFANNQDLTKDERKEGMRRLVSGGTPIGVVAYDAREPVGWCSVAPRESYVKLERSRTMPRVTDSDTPTWTVLCFFVVRSARGEGVSLALLRDAVDYAREAGAEIVEGYPFDTAGISSRHRGHSRVFEAAGFQQDGRRWFLELR